MPASPRRRVRPPRGPHRSSAQQGDPSSWRATRQERSRRGRLWAQVDYPRTRGHAHDHAAVMYADARLAVGSPYSDSNAAHDRLMRLRAPTTGSSPPNTETAQRLQRRDTLLYFYCCTPPLRRIKVGPRPLGGPGFVGRGGGIRTHGLFVPNEARYQAAPHPAEQPAQHTRPQRLIRTGGRASAASPRAGSRTESVRTDSCRDRRRHGSTSGRPSGAASGPGRGRCHSS